MRNEASFVGNRSRKPNRAAKIVETYQFANAYNKAKSTGSKNRMRFVVRVRQPAWKWCRVFDERCAFANPVSNGTSDSPSNLSASDAPQVMQISSSG